jgi:hypothetical protein
MCIGSSRMRQQGGGPVAAEQTASAARFGFWASIGTGVVTLVTFAIAIATPPPAGPLCKADCYSYPYLDVAERFPRDYYWMFPAIVGLLFFVAFMIGLASRNAAERRPMAQLAVALAVMAALTLIGDYVLQLAVIQPSLLAGEKDGVSLLTQFNPHGVFIALEELGYMLMSAALACVGTTLLRASRLERVLGWLAVAGLGINLVSLAWFVARYGHSREYLFEIAVITVDWLVLIPAAFIAAKVFSRDLKQAV